VSDLLRFFSGCRSVAELGQLVEVVADLASAASLRVRLTIETRPDGAFVAVQCGRPASPRTWDANTYVDSLMFLDAACSHWGLNTTPDSYEWWGELAWPVGEVIL
jgi:hypothetical protein